MEHEKDYSLLRPFDLEAAKRGEKIIENTPFGFNIEFKGSLSNGSKLLIEYEDGSGGERYSHQILMAPLCWVEGKPVYKGDVLYNRMNDNKVVFDHMCLGCNLDSTFTWTKPKQKRDGWMNLYESGENYVYPTKQQADSQAAPSRIGCIHIEWEE